MTRTEDIIETIARLGDLSTRDAKLVYKHYQHIGVLRHDKVSGQWNVTHGAFLDKDVIHKALVAWKENH